MYCGQTMNYFCRLLAIAAIASYLPTSFAQTGANYGKLAQELSAQSAAQQPAQIQEATQLFKNAFELFRFGDFKLAVIAFNRGLLLDPGNGLAHYYLAETMSRTEDRVGALEHYQLAMALLPGTSVESVKAESAIATMQSAIKEAAWPRSLFIDLSENTNQVIETFRKWENGFGGGPKYEFRSVIKEAETSIAGSIGRPASRLKKSDTLQDSDAIGVIDLILVENEYGGGFSDGHYKVRWQYRVRLLDSNRKQRRSWEAQAAGKCPTGSDWAPCAKQLAKKALIEVADAIGLDLKKQIY